MELTEGILKSIDSLFEFNRYSSGESYIIKYKDIIIRENGKIKIFGNIGSAKNYLLKFVRMIFWRGEEFQRYKSNIKKQTGYDVDFSATITILPSYGEINRFDLPESKKMFKDIRDKMLENQIVKIEKL